jgi:hypothetical protein
MRAGLPALVACGGESEDRRKSALCTALTVRDTGVDAETPKLAVPLYRAMILRGCPFGLGGKLGTLSSAALEFTELFPSTVSPANEFDEPGTPL